MIFDSEGRNVFRMVLPDREVRFQITPNGLYYFNAADRDNIVMLLNMVTETREGFTHRDYEGGPGSAESDEPTGVPVGTGL